MQVKINICSRLAFLVFTLLLVFEAVAVVPARTMSRPFSHTDPAKLVLAFLASHVLQWARMRGNCQPPEAEATVRDGAQRLTLQPPFFSIVA